MEGRNGRNEQYSGASEGKIHEEWEDTRNVMKRYEALSCSSARGRRSGMRRWSWFVGLGKIPAIGGQELVPRPD